MFRRFSRVLRAPEEEQGAAGADEQGADSTADQGTKGAEQKSINSQAKELPWVRDALAAKAELDRMKAEQAEAQQKAERKQAESKGEYEKALKMEQDKIAELERKHQVETRRLTLAMEFTRAGLVDSRAVQLFETDFDPEKEKPEEFVARIKADETNSLYFTDPKKRPKTAPPPAAGVGGGEDYDPSWIDSDDPKKRNAAIQKNRAAFWAAHHAKTGRGVPQ